MKNNLKNTLEDRLMVNQKKKNSPLKNRSTIAIFFVIFFWGCSNSSDTPNNNKYENKIENCSSLSFIDIKRYPLNTKMDLEKLDSVVLTSIENQNKTNLRSKIFLTDKFYDKQFKEWSFKFNIDTLSTLFVYKFDFFFKTKEVKSFELNELKNGRIFFYANDSNYSECGLIRYVINGKEFINRQNISF